MQNLFLIGPMGSGKTSIGRQLAERMDLEFFDSDKEIENRTGVDIALIFEIEGEEGFRQREEKMIEELAVKSDCVIATGGGVILAEKNRLCLKATGRVVYLKSSAANLHERTIKDKRRPLLNTEDRFMTIKDILKVRGPIYEDVADIIVSTDDKTIKQIIETIVKQVEEA